MNESIKKQKRSKEEILEISVAIFLGVPALATAWGSWIGSLHGGNQATNYTMSTNLASEGNSMYNDASQDLMQDMMMWNQISEASINLSFAEDQNDVVGVEKYNWQLEQLMTDNCSEDFLDAIIWALDQEEYTSPFEKEGFVESYFVYSNELIAESEGYLEQGKQDNASGDAFGLVTVIYSVVLFMLGIVGTFKNLPNRFLILCVAIVGFLFASIYMLTLPMPTGFSLMSFFGA